MLNNFEWISIRDKEPLPNNWVLTCNEGYHGGYLCWYDGNLEFFIHGRGKYKQVWNDKDKTKPTHWMYFPRPVGVTDGYPATYE